MNSCSPLQKMDLLRTSNAIPQASRSITAVYDGRVGSAKTAFV
jgi:hypothetical protein